MPLVVAVNKIDKENADVDTTLLMLEEVRIDIETTPIVQISALKVTNSSFKLKNVYVSVKLCFFVGYRY